MKILMVNKFLFRIIYSIEARKKIGKLIEKFQPYIVHLNNYNFQITPSIIYEIKKYNIPIVHTLHDYALICHEHNLYSRLLIKKQMEKGSR